MTVSREDAEFLLNRPEFLRFMYSAIQSAGLFSNTVAADGRTVRDQCLEWHEGRRSLGHELLNLVDAGIPDALRSPDGLPLATLDKIIREAMNPKENPDGRRNDDD